MRLLIYIITITALTALLGGSFGRQTAKASSTDDRILGKVQKISHPEQYISRWGSILDNYRLIKHNNLQTSRTNAWKKFVHHLKDESPTKQILKVNLWLNSYPYKQDNWAYNTSDYWSTLGEFLDNGGDCEDFAIAKYLTLKYLGFDPNKMKIAIVYDTYSGTDHALLIVHHHNQTYVLDNRENMTVQNHYADRYKAYYAFNEKQLWAYDQPVIVRKLRDHNQAVLPGNR